MRMEKRIIVAGAGASGLMAAITAARCGAQVTILEAMERPGKKLLITGNGRCNLTNMDPDLEKSYYGRDASFAEPVIAQFGAADTREFFEELGLLTVEKNGYVYPYTGQSSSVWNVLLAEIRRLGVRLKLTEKIAAIRKEDGVWCVSTATWTYQADCLILCCGSQCAPQTGSDGSGYRLAEMAGLRQNRVAPALVPLVCKEHFLGKLAGVRCHARVTLVDGQGAVIRTETGEVQWTKYGISGIAVFQLSRYVSLSDRPEAFRVVLDLFDSFQPETVIDLLTKRSVELGSEKVPVLLEGLLNEKLIPVLLERAGISLKTRCQDLSFEAIQTLVQLGTQFSLTVQGTKGFNVCQVCAGGIDTSQIFPKTMECRRIPGLYFAGELLDIDGPCGGYNLQWAWSSGYVAGKHAAQ